MKSSIQSIKKLCTGIFLMLLCPSITHAQVPNTAAGYAFTAYSGTYTPLSGGTPVTAIQSDDTKAQNIPVGFSFPFTTGSYSTVSVCSNGWMSLSNVSSTTTSNSTSSASTLGPVMMPLFDDLNGSPNGQASYLTTGSSPNRVFTFEWKNWRWYYNSTGVNNNVLSFQVKLYESGRIEFIYNEGPDAVSGSSPSATIGIAKNSTDYQTLNNSTSSATASSTTFTTSINAKPTSGQVYSWDIPCSAPTGLASANVTTNSAQLSWTAVSGSQGYEYVLDNTSANPTGPGTAYSSTTLNIGSLFPTTTYYFHLRNKCGTTSFSNWTTTSFTTQTSCFPTTSISVSNMTASTGTLNWSPVSGAANYEYVIDQNSGNPSGNGTAISATSVNFSGLTGNTSYYAHVRHVCLATDKSIWTHFQFITPPCDRPTNVIISNITDTSADLLWSLMPNGTKYEYAIDFSNQPPVSGIQTTTGITAHVSSLIPNSKYYVHVRSGCFVSDNSAWRLDSFVTLSTCYAPQVQVNNLGTNQPVAYWDPVPASLGYEYALNNSLQTPAFGISTFNTTVTLNLPDDGNAYFLHVRTKCNSMFTYSPWFSIQLRDGTTGINTVTQNMRPEIYPNPVTETLHIKTNATGGRYTITDITGRALLQGMLTSPVTEVNTATLAPGIYILKYNSNDAELQLKFTRQ